MKHDMKTHSNKWRRALRTTAALVLAGCAISCSQNDKLALRIEKVDLARASMAPQLAQLGAGNWVVVADAAYSIPPGVGAHVMCVDLDSADTFREVLDLLELQGNLTPRIWVNEEMYAVPEHRAPGMKAYRKTVSYLLQGRVHYRIDQKYVQYQLKEAANNCRVLYIKTNSQLPYSALAMELDSGYWNAEAEQEMFRKLQEYREKENPQPAAQPAGAAPADAINTLENNFQMSTDIPTMTV